MPRGFTIVELLVVIVVIGILAAITIVSYTGISQKATAAILQSDLGNASKQIKLFQAASPNNDFPTAIVCPAPGATEVCVKTSGSNTPYVYAYNNTTNPKTFTLDTTNGTLAYRITNNTAPVAVSGSSSKYWKQIGSGFRHTCAISSDDKAYCWGDNQNDELGNGNNTNSSVPIAVNTTGVLSGKTIKTLAVGPSNTCVIASDDKAYCWGFNSYGNLGDGSNNDSNVPVAVSVAGVLSGKTTKSITVGSDNACVIASDDKAYCWGGNAYGDLGNNQSGVQSNVPVAVNTAGVLSGKTIKSIAAGNDYHICAIASDNLVYCWGINDSGQLGNNTIINSPVSVAVNTAGALSGKTVKYVSVAAVRTCVVASDDKAYCWGDNGVGQLGDGSTNSSHIPIAVNTSGVLSSKTILSISASSNHTCAIASDNQAYCWGINSNGQLGNNSTTYSNVPVAVNTMGVLASKNVQSVSAGGAHTCSIASDNQAYCWGQNGYNDFMNGDVIYGQLGNNSVVLQSLIPVAVQPLP